VQGLKGIDKMSGFFGYVGTQPCKDILIKGISSLKKRGADATGMVFKNQNTFDLISVNGNASELKQASSKTKCDFTTGIAQSSKFTRIKASEEAANPVYNNLFAVAMDGSFENFNELKRWSNNPFEIVSDEDLMLALLCVANKSDKIELIKTLDSMLLGDISYAFIANDENAIYCKSLGKPLFIGIGSDGFYVSSELISLVNTAEKYIFINEGESAKLTKDRVIIFDTKGKKIKKTATAVPEQSCFENDYAIKDEIFYCPLTVKETYKQFIKKSKINLDYLKLNRHAVDKISQIIITGAGCSYNVASISAYNFSMMCDIPTYAYPSGELRYSGCIINKNTLLIAVSHRGESDDTIACVKRFKNFGAKVIAVTSNELSYLARLSDEIVNPNCDFESNDVSLRCFISTYLAMSFLSLYIGNKNGVVTELYLNVTIKMAELLSGKVSSAIKPSPLFEKVAYAIADSDNVFVTGLGADYSLSLEGADKLRSIAKVNASSFCTSELVEKCHSILNGSLVLALLTNKDLLQQSLYNLRRAKSLGANVIIITTQNIEEEVSDFENIISFNDSIPLFNVLPCIAGIYKIAIITDEIKNKPDIEIA
jgi:glucosamine--fructose-6-phosphate aminotransferase (isomerizing)